MSARGRASLINRIRQIRSASSQEAPLVETQLPASPTRIQALEARVAHLEELVEGFQDSVYRETQRENQRLADLEARIDPAAIAASLSKDARERGL